MDVAERKQTKTKTRKWNDKEIDLLIDYLEEHLCLWDIFSKDYHLKDKRDKAYEAIKEELDIPSADIKYKIVGLRSQLSREVAKTNQKKSGQGVRENYKSTWIYWDKLQFLMPVIKAGKSLTLTLTLSLQEQADRPQSVVSPDAIQLDEDLENDTENEESDVKSSVTKSSKRRAEHEIVSKKHAVLDRCLHVLSVISPST